MRRILKGIVCAAVSLGLPALAETAPPLPAPVPDCQTIPEAFSTQLFDELIGWIALHTSYDLLPAYQAPATVSFCEIHQAVEYEGADLIVEEGLLAAYDVTRRHIYLVEPWSPEDLYDRSVLLHEMVHDIQWSNREWNCAGEPELEAYMLQNKWLLEHGISHPFNWGLIFRMSECGPGN